MPYSIILSRDSSINGSWRNHWNVLYQYKMHHVSVNSWIKSFVTIEISGLKLNPGDVRKLIVIEAEDKEAAVRA